MLSVVVPTHNRSRKLELALRSFEKQTLARHHFEIIVVDNGSTDDTRFVVANSAKGENVKYFYNASPGLHVGRHVGFREAKGDILVYVDDDIEAFPTMLEAIDDAFKRSDVALVGGKCIPKFESEPPQWLAAMWQPNAEGDRVLSALSLIDLGDDPKEIDPRFVFGCNFSIRRRVLSKAQGFHPDGMPEQLIRYRGDGETYVANFIAAKGYKAQYVPLASVYHWVSSNRMTADYFCLRAFNQGISDSYAAIRRDRGIGLPSFAPADPQPTPSMPTLRRLAGRIWLRGKKALLSMREFIVRSAVAEKKRSKEIADAYQNGYKFHQSAAREDENLRAWILRADYWDCEIPPWIDNSPTDAGVGQGHASECSRVRSKK